jgi:hypothetical protein
MVIPVNDMPYLTSLEMIVQENKLDSDFDTELKILIGQEMGLQVDDMDGSQSLDAQLMGFPANAIDISFGISRDGVTATTDIPSGTVTISGNVVDVVPVLLSLTLTLAHDDDRNFRIEVDGVSTDRNELYEVVSAPFGLEHQVIVPAVADTPTLDVGASIKTLSAEDSTLSPYPVEIGLNDLDGSETFLVKEVIITYSTPTDIATGVDPVMHIVGPLLLVAKVAANSSSQDVLENRRELSSGLKLLHPAAHSSMIARFRASTWRSQWFSAFACKNELQ